MVDAYEHDKGSTHWEGCYRERRHHNCAVVEVDRLRAENERLREALVEAIPFIGYQAYVPDIVARCWALVGEATDD